MYKTHLIYLRYKGSDTTTDTRQEIVVLKQMVDVPNPLSNQGNQVPSMPKTLAALATHLTIKWNRQEP